MAIASEDTAQKTKVEDCHSMDGQSIEWVLDSGCSHHMTVLKVARIIVRVQ
ncbi:hypothetical protein LINGRAHAP2_LOCUS7593, partial [Linum grandiflorum]